MTGLSPTSIPVFVINIESSPDRYQHAEQQLRALGIQPQRFNAIYGKHLSEQDLQACYDKNTNRRQFRRSLSLGEIGCYLSHRGVWQHMLDHNIDIAVVLEDDIEIDATFTQALQQLAGLTGWDHIKLSDDRNTAPHQIMPLPEGFTLANFKKVPNCATGYAIRLQGAKKLLRRQTFFRPVDVDLQFGHELDLQLFSLLPYSIWPSSRFNSEIDTISSGRRKGDTTFFRNLTYRLTAAWHRARYTSGDLTRITRQPVIPHG